jgi:hypothetical protein
MRSRFVPGFRIQSLILALAFFVAPACFAVDPQNTTSREHPFAKHLEQQYLRFLAAARSGDVATWLRMRPRETAKEMGAMTSRELKQDAAAFYIDTKEYEFQGVETAKGVARSVYLKRAPEATHQSAVMFHLEGGDWKIGQVMNVADLGKKRNTPEELKKIRDDLLSDPRVQLPK